MKVNNSILLVICVVIIAFLLGMLVNEKQGGEVDPIPSYSTPEKETEQSTTIKSNEKKTELNSNSSAYYNPPQLSEVNCPICDGDGFDPRDLHERCFGCKGLCKVDENTARRLRSLDESKWPYVKKQYYDCPMCFGTGFIGGGNIMDLDLITTKSCNYCHQRKKVDAKEYSRIFRIKEEMIRNGIPLPWMPPL